MKNPNLLIPLISATLTLFFATLFGFAGSSIAGSFWGWFWVTVLIQVIGFAIINSYFIRRDQQIQQTIELEELKELSKTSVTLYCSYCQQPSTVPILLNQKNTFKCESCNQTNGISMQFMATSLTSPVESVKIPTEDSTIAEFKVSR